VIVIDHHNSNKGFGSLNLVEPSYPAVAQVLFDLFRNECKDYVRYRCESIHGIYTDTGGFKYTETSARTFNIAAELVAYVPEFPQIISDMEMTRLWMNWSFKEKR